MSEVHAKYSPSKLPRIIACPGSTALTAHIEETPSEYAAEGTMLHKVTEKALILQQTELSQGLAIEYKLTEEHIEAVNEILEFVTVLKMAQEEAPALEVVEQKVSLELFSRYNTADISVLNDVYGTLDYCLFFRKAKTLYVIDWKYGRGVEVFPNSDQLKAYALGAMATFSHDNIKRVMTIIGQPRLYSGEHFKEHEYAPHELTDWLYKTLLPALVAANQAHELVYPKDQQPLAQSQIDRLIKCDKLILRPSGEACMWCRLKNTCAARRNAAISVAEEVFKIHAKLPDKTNPEEITSLLVKASDLRKYLADLELYVMRQIQEGIDVPLFKMVAGRSLRKWGDEAVMLAYAASLGYTQDDMSTKKIMSPAQAEKKVGPAIKKSDLFQSLIIKPEGKPTLVLKTDKRRAISYKTASDKFADFIVKTAETTK